MNYAAITKAKAMYGKRFTDADFQMLMNVSNVEAGAQYLKDHPAFTKAFSDINVKGIRRTDIEAVLKRQYYIDFSRLTKGLDAKDKQLVYAYLKKYEIEAILWALRKLDGEPFEKQNHANLYATIMSDISKVNIAELSKCTDKIGLISALPEEYAKILSRHNDYLTVENELWKNYTVQISTLLKGKFPKDDSRILFGIQTDIRNIISIYRLKKYFGLTGSEITPYLYLPTYKFGESEISRMCEAEEDKHYAQMFSQSHYKIFSRISNGEYIEALANEYTVTLAKRLIHFSKSAPAVIYAYTVLKLSEIGKIKTVIESIRYNLNREMIEDYVGTKTKIN